MTTIRARSRWAPPPNRPASRPARRPSPGTYRRTRYAHDTFEKILQLDADKEITVTPSGDALEIDGVRYVEVEPLLFRRIAADGPCAFATDARGRSPTSCRTRAPTSASTWYETPASTAAC